MAITLTAQQRANAREFVEQAEAEWAYKSGRNTASPLFEAAARYDDNPSRNADTVTSQPYGDNRRARRTAKAPQAVRVNRYPGFCPDCSTKVEAEAGRLENVDGRWITRHLDGECPQPEPVAWSIRTNQYAGRCGTCHNTVEAGEGRVERGDNGWIAYHLDGECPSDEVDLHGVTPDRRYAVASTTEGQDWTFLRVTKDGRVLVQAGPAEHPTSRKAADDYLRRIAADPASGARYGQELGHCGDCGRELTDAVSRSEGYGPICRGKF